MYRMFACHKVAWQRQPTTYLVAALPRLDVNNLPHDVRCGERKMEKEDVCGTRAGVVAWRSDSVCGNSACGKVDCYTSGS